MYICIYLYIYIDYIYMYIQTCPPFVSAGSVFRTVRRGIEWSTAFRLCLRDDQRRQFSPGVSTEKAFEMDVQQLLPSLLMETGTRYSSIQRSTSTYDLCLLRTTVIDCCTPVPGLAPGLAATSTPPLFFLFFSLLISFHPSRFSYSPSSTRSPNLRYVPILRDSRSSYWRFKSLRNCVR